MFRDVDSIGSAATGLANAQLLLRGTQYPMELSENVGTTFVDNVGDVGWIWCRLKELADVEHMGVISFPVSVVGFANLEIHTGVRDKSGAITRHLVRAFILQD